MLSRGFFVLVLLQFAVSDVACNNGCSLTRLVVLKPLVAHLLCIEGRRSLAFDSQGQLESMLLTVQTPAEARCASIFCTGSDLSTMRRVCCRKTMEQFDLEFALKCLRCQLSIQRRIQGFNDIKEIMELAQKKEDYFAKVRLALQQPAVLTNARSTPCSKRTRCRRTSIRWLAASKSRRRRTQRYHSKHLSRLGGLRKFCSISHSLRSG
jgi:hypothetical protein